MERPGHRRGAEIVEDPQQVHRIERLQLHTWALIPDRLFVRLPLTEITGQLLPLHPGGITVEQHDDSPSPVGVGVLRPNPGHGASWSSSARTMGGLSSSRAGQQRVQSGRGMAGSGAPQCPG
jgi:hypothetical protein